MSQVLKLVCLAKSWKHQGYCIAGKTADGSWVRTVTSNANNNAIFNQANGVEPLDVFEVEVLGHSPSAHQTENYLINERKMFNAVSSLGIDDIDDLELVDTPEDLWGTGESSRYGLNDKIDLDKQEEPSNSLLLIQPDDTIFVIMQNEYDKEKIRIKFTYNGDDYCLTTTDLSIQDYYRDPENKLYEGEEEEIEARYLSISLAEPLNNSLYKVVAGVF
ncbi:hypothetical protein ACCH09_003454 [Edwardsiella ictaluri]|nr:hypothetical protein [Edwardsiella ictaluri]EKS7778160.1 hypothetical protein [Edwardsiella ictaluri]EKS7791621.1 hypothetical protein [Edwardsiella ictaluri]EKS7798300.1 hypothetical protein [Edwardsiella ictaluri]EKS7811463.1 hypothetical protein [Edwardsiella ictaluri]